MNETIKKYTTKNRKFKLAPDGKFIKVYINGRLNGFIWNNDTIIQIDGEAVISSRLFN